MLKDFRAFVLRGNVVDLAVGVVIGAAFGTVVSSFVKNLLTPLVTIPGKVNFSSLHVTIRHSVFNYGQVINDIVSFVIIAAAVFFLVVRPINTLVARRRVDQDPAAETRDCPECLSSVPAAARRCAFCTASLTPVATEA